WLADITYVPTYEGWLFLAVVMDVCIRKIVGWAMRAREGARSQLPMRQPEWIVADPTTIVQRKQPRQKSEISRGLGRPRGVHKPGHAPRSPRFGEGSGQSL